MTAQPLQFLTFAARASMQCRKSNRLCQHLRRKAPPLYAPNHPPCNTGGMKAFMKGSVATMGEPPYNLRTHSRPLLPNQSTVFTLLTP